jgi:putative tryptophan/tyrosine transport system substrate-binding protein
VSTIQLLPDAFLLVSTLFRTLSTASALFVTLSVTSPLLMALCSPADAQDVQRVFSIGRISAGSPSDPLIQGGLDAFRQGLQELGWVKDRNISLHARWAGEKEKSLDELAAELVGLKVDVIIAIGSPVIEAAKKATSTIPIVMAASGADPVTAGFVKSLARPGTNITGMTLLSTELSSKRLELLKDVLSDSKRIAILRNPEFPAVAVQWKETEAAAESLGLQLHPYDTTNRRDIDNAFKAMATTGTRGLVVFSDPVLLERNRSLIISLASKYRFPAVYPWRNYAEEGGLMSYAANLNEMHGRSATYVDKILKGAKPADLPVEQPTKFELVINLKTAKQLGLTIPSGVLARADRVIK